jgi:hypothetical protein
MRKRAARKSGARTPRHHRYAQAVTGAQRGRELRLVFRQHHDHGQHAKGRQAVAFVRLGLLAGRENGFRRQHPGEGRSHCHAPGSEPHRVGGVRFLTVRILRARVGEIHGLGRLYYAAQHAPIVSRRPTRGGAPCRYAAAPVPAILDLRCHRRQRLGESP